MGALPLGVNAKRPSARAIRCHVAGSRYHVADLSDLQAGAAVQVLRRHCRGQVCYEVVDARAQRIGYLPRELVPRVDERGVVAAWLCAVNPHAVPWKQLEVTLVLG